MCCNFINSSKSLSSFMSAKEAELLIGKAISDIERHSKYKLDIHRDEMLKMGVIGLVKAATDYDASKSCKFSTFAYPCIRNTIINEGKKLRKKEIPIASLKGRKYDDEEEIARQVLEAGKDPYEKSVIGISKMEKLLGKKEFSFLLGDLVTKPKGKPTRVQESDRREEMVIDAKNDFESMEVKR